MQWVEQHIISKHDPRGSAIDAACFLSKNLYNPANYLLHQEYVIRNFFRPFA